MILVTGVISSQAFSQGTGLKYKDDTTNLKGYYVHASVKQAKKLPSILIIHAWMGITEHEKTSADRLGKLGYNVLVADIYGEDIHPADAKEAGALAGFYKKNYTVYQSRIKAALKALEAQGNEAGNVVVMGYCFGGTGALEAVRAGFPVKGIVSFHGGLGKDSLRANVPVTAKVLILHGADDPYVPAHDVKQFQQEMHDGKGDWQMVYYANAVHAFTDPAAGNDNSKGAAYNKLADERSWKAMLVFLEEVAGSK
ncbi:MAG: dienelactone hydrolase family protein [Bacteroidetes bacterium]|nr:dienelactone hydrolase family protein [Bacteroidota bacterium]